MPMGIEISSQVMAPPKTSEAVTGAARATIVLTSCLFAKDLPSERSTTTRLRNFRYCM
jgi:hypothetical protein